MSQKALSKLFFEYFDTAALPLGEKSGFFPCALWGLPNVARAHFISALLVDRERPLFIFTPDEKEAAELSHLILGFSGVEANILSGRELRLRPVAARTRADEASRLKSLYEILSGARINIVTAEGALLRPMPPDVLGRSVKKLKRGNSVKIETLELFLLSCGYKKTEMVSLPGQFARRGGILDFFSPQNEDPVRMEFWGDEIDYIGHFDSESQRRFEDLNEALILPASEVLPSEYEGSLGKFLDKLDKLLKKSEAGSARAEFFTREFENLRDFGELSSPDLFSPMIYGGEASVFDYIDDGAEIIIDSPRRFSERLRELCARYDEEISSFSSDFFKFVKSAELVLPRGEFWESLENQRVFLTDSFASSAIPVTPKSSFSFEIRQIPAFHGSIKAMISDIKEFLGLGAGVLILTHELFRAELMEELLREEGIEPMLNFKDDSLPGAGEVMIKQGSLGAGFFSPKLSLAVLSDDLLMRKPGRAQKRRKARKKGALSDVSELKIGDLVVHDIHGLCRFAGLRKMTVHSEQRDYIKLNFLGKDALYLPVSSIQLIAKYMGASDDKAVKLSKLGGTDWSNKIARAKASVKEMAAELIALYSERQALKGHAFSPDSPWQTEFEQRFDYSETEDQLKCTEEIKSDMEKPQPMDRLLCGDVGFGKTEVSLRAVMKCVLDGKQAALLAPTTVLATQHYNAALARFMGYPVEIRLLSRYTPAREVRKTLKELCEGRIDFLIGTHRLLGSDVKFRDLGLLIVDEEQRFGVSQKEKLKTKFKNVDVLTLSATPIPRTLNMALSGIRDFSSIEEPPFGRQTVATYVMEYDQSSLKEAMERELSRGGQVFYIYNRIEGLERKAYNIQRMLPEARVRFAHGRMSDDEMDGTFEAMLSGDCDILVSTTIIENGIDMPNVNTLIVEDADRFGLAQLHQIRGRVGRSGRKAYAYFCFRKGRVLSETAEQRLGAIKEFAEFNSGIKIAMRDLEIRGAGRLLGAQQSGHLTDVGYDMYLRILEEAIAEEKGLEPVDAKNSTADIVVSAIIPESYVGSQELRMSLYRRIAELKTEEEELELIDELIDRFGEPPDETISLIRIARLRAEAAELGFSDISQKDRTLYFAASSVSPEKFLDLSRKSKYRGRLRALPGEKPLLSLELKESENPLKAAESFIYDWSL